LLYREAQIGVEQKKDSAVSMKLLSLTKPLIDGPFSEFTGSKKDFFVRDFNATFASLFLKGVSLQCCARQFAGRVVQTYFSHCNLI
jgi:hypothetical protein